MKYGIYGGAFNPFHNEHLAVIQAAKKELDLDKIVIVPSGNAPHKKTLTDYQDRVNMIKLSVDDADYIIDDIENTLDGLTNTARILPLIAEKYGDIVFIIGGDSFSYIETWIKPEVILSYPLAVVPRVSGRDKLVEKAAYYNAQGKNIVVLDHICKDVSSSEIRTKIELGLEVNEIPERVLEYAVNHKLYCRFGEMLLKLRPRLTDKRYNHSLLVALTAFKLNAQLNLDYDSVMTAAILHDCAKSSTRPHPEVDPHYAQGPIAHAFFGAIEIQTDFGVTDPDVINAVRFHTTGRKNMSALEKLIYLADLIEPSRDFEGVEDLREISFGDFETGFIEAVKRQHKYLGNGKNICPLTAECYEYYCKEPLKPNRPF